MKRFKYYYIEDDIQDVENLVRIVYDTTDKELWMDVQLADYPGFWKRCWNALKYIFGFKCSYGHWDVFSFNKQSAQQVRQILNEYLNAKKMKNLKN